MPDWIYAALFLAILALGILLVGEQKRWKKTLTVSN